ncbi:TetR/AcrR family transcriptional regulator [Paenibacillus macquariensis]|uniref:Transcriptional regulator, TetR family n=1 Tax=Paenibacillus macquariensis TaxID=948756 RepID=A0ABY1K0H7_9BACL|nr:TetR/AcrR family transcriptional regulator [Paenibacillus macquariensis]MEC0091472.1 TetR/AcrR family transcriptional regulator [Paenibacillus macquariensis]OAB38148.1 TetR family transcriptional regulator [Paenibacillus macquariensis subsp. macquariensis]SIR07458.1 transcriptional regulator, TetR family [Paenibacillus macquariensis]
MKEMEDKIRTPQQERSIKTKEAIVEAAMKLFSDKGFHRTNTKQIAALAGVSTGSFYSYYIDKRAVFIDVLKIYNNALLERVEASLVEVQLHSHDKQAAITYLIDSLIASHGVYSQFHKELAVMYEADEEIKLLMDEQHDLGRRKTLNYLQMGKEELKVKDLEAASIVVYDAMQSIVDTVVFSTRSVSADRLKTELTRMITGYLFN